EEVHGQTLEAAAHVADAAAGERHTHVAPHACGMSRPRSSCHAEAVSRAVRSHENLLACIGPKAASSAAKSACVSTFSRAAASASTLDGGTRTPADPTTSGSDVVSEQTTGTPDARASATWKPKPSYQDGSA